jgi:hypothetical protein
MLSRFAKAPPSALRFHAQDRNGWVFQRAGNQWFARDVTRRHNLLHTHPFPSPGIAARKNLKPYLITETSFSCSRSVDMKVRSISISLSRAFNRSQLVLLTDTKQVVTDIVA